MQIYSGYYFYIEIQMFDDYYRVAENTTVKLFKKIHKD